MPPNEHDVVLLTPWGAPVAYGNSGRDKRNWNTVGNDERMKHELFYPATIDVNGNIWERTVSRNTGTISYAPPGSTFTEYHVTFGEPDTTLRTIGFHETRYGVHNPSEGDMSYNMNDGNLTIPRQHSRAAAAPTEP